VAGNPRIYAQLVQVLAPYTRVIKQEASHHAAHEGEQGHEPTPEDALAATLHAGAAAPAPAPAKKGPVRIRRADLERGTRGGDQED
jgi:myo-inositol-1(or 4)-monophosphatase